MKQFILKRISMRDSKNYIEDAEIALNNPPKGYEVWNIIFNSATMNE